MLLDCAIKAVSLDLRQPMLLQGPLCVDTSSLAK